MEFKQFNINNLMNVTSRPEIMFIKGHGSWLEDHDGKKYLDFIQGWAVNSLGHCPEEIRLALTNQSNMLISLSPAFYNIPSSELSSRLTNASCFDRVFFTSSGAEANEGAIKLARKWGKIKRDGAYKIISMKNGFHGRTLATMSASDKSNWDRIFAPKVEGFMKAKINDLSSVSQLIDSDTVAIMLEPVQGEGGVIPAKKEFMQGIRLLANQHNLLFIVDEIQTGMGRTGTMFAYQQSGVIPDIMTLGKGLGGGVPLAALLAREEVCVFENGDQGGTYSGNPICTAAGLAVFDTLNSPDFLQSVKDRSKQLSDGLHNLALKWKFIGERGLGLLRVLILDRDDGQEITKKALNLQPNGLLLNSPQPNLLRFMPALNVSQETIIHMLESLDCAISQVRI